MAAKERGSGEKMLVIPVVPDYTTGKKHHWQPKIHRVVLI